MPGKRAVHRGIPESGAFITDYGKEDFAFVFRGFFDMQIIIRVKCMSFKCSSSFWLIQNFEGNDEMS